MTNFYADDWGTDEFKHGVEVGKSFGQYETSEEAQRAFDAGEIELWLEWQRPKTEEDWNAFYEKHGSEDEMKARWAEK